jgi:hypothetical protein
VSLSLLLEAKGYNETAAKGVQSTYHFEIHVEHGVYLSELIFHTISPSATVTSFK